MSTSKTATKRSRCSNGTRKNKKTGKCESVLHNTCAICLDRITSDNVKTQCKHNFHKRCLIGWCKRTKDKPTCPVCRKDIKDTCVKIEPFDSTEVFRYVDTYTSELDNGLRFRMQKVSEMIHHKGFDVNVKNEDGKSILDLLSRNTEERYLNDIDYLLGKPNIEVSSELISWLISYKRSKTIQLFKKHKKIPKGLKGLI